MTTDATNTTDAGGSQLVRGVRPVADTRRLGRFTAPAQWAREFRTELKRVMGLCIVVRAEQLYAGDVIEYWASSEHFRALPFGEVVPEYRWVFTDAGDLWCEEVKA